jgi:hypothetical protein
MTQKKEKEGASLSPSRILRTGSDPPTLLRMTGGRKDGDQKEGREEEQFAFSAISSNRDVVTHLF